MSWPGLLLLTVTLMTPGEEECSIIQAAHQTFLKSSFTCERHLTIKVNGELKVYEVTRLTYNSGELTRETLEKDVLDENLELEEEKTEATLSFPFDCHRLKRLEQGVVELSSSDGTERVVFVWDRRHGVLRPSRWASNETTRFLWKKYVIEAVAEYKDFAWVWPDEIDRASTQDQRHRLNRAVMLQAVSGSISLSSQQHSTKLQGGVVGDSESPPAGGTPAP